VRAGRVRGGGRRGPRAARPRLTSLRRLLRSRAGDRGA
jgi:hypothetical protein